MRTFSTVLSLAAALFIAGGPAAAAQSADDPQGRAAALTTIRESLLCLQHGEDSDDAARKIEWYGRGKDLAERALELAPESADAHFALFANWGRMLQTDGWLKNAFHLPALQRELDRALELDPNHADALAAKGGLYLELPAFLGGDIRKAEPLLRRAVELDQESVAPRLELAECVLQQNQRDEARRLARTALRLAEKHGRERQVERAGKLLNEIEGREASR